MSDESCMEKDSIRSLEWEEPSMNHLKVFGCVCYAQVPKENRSKVEETSEECIFIGYSSMSKGYKLYNLKTMKVIISHGKGFLKLVRKEG